MDWQPIETAPRDGAVFIARNADHPEWGSWPMLRRVRHVLQNGEWQCVDKGAWLHVNAIEADYHEGNDTLEQAAVPFSLACDHLNENARYEWQPLPGSYASQPPSSAAPLRVFGR